MNEIRSDLKNTFGHLIRSYQTSQFKRFGIYHYGFQQISNSLDNIILETVVRQLPDVGETRIGLMRIAEHSEYQNNKHFCGHQCPVATSKTK